MNVPYFSMLRILSDGKFHSGERMGRTLGASRAVVLSNIRKIEALGLRISRARGRGYRLDTGLDLVDRRALVSALKATSPVLSVETIDECPSTNSMLAERAARGAKHGTVLFAEIQSAGRGRRGNSWHSAVGGSLTFSVLWRFSRGAGALAGLSLAVAVGAARALARAGAADIQLKWPNDLFCRERKLGGILIEISGGASGPSAAIVGVGVNYRLDAALRGRIGQPVTDLASCCDAVPSRTDLLCAVLGSVTSTLEQFALEGFAPFRDEWLSRHAWQGRQVALSLADRRVAEGAVVGVAEDGALVLASSRGIERFHSGELSLRPA
jgi:BirA family biotin operon repressor/biotin-[acetyl-CoA-carboxylase] ligase